MFWHKEISSRLNHFLVCSPNNSSSSFFTNKPTHSSIHHRTRTTGDFKGWRVWGQKPAGGEMFYKLILLSGSLFSTHGFTWQERERELWQSFTWAWSRSSPCMCCLHLSVRLPSAIQHLPYLYWHSSPSFQAAKACMTKWLRLRGKKCSMSNTDYTGTGFSHTYSNRSIVQFHTSRFCMQVCKMAGNRFMCLFFFPFPDCLNMFFVMFSRQEFTPYTADLIAALRSAFICHLGVPPSPNLKQEVGRLE